MKPNWFLDSLGNMKLMILFKIIDSNILESMQSREIGL